MKSLMIIVVGLALLNSTGLALSAEIPAPSKRDPRLREVRYAPDQVYRINIVLGVGTHIVLGPDEKIQAAAPGFGADCKDDSMDWCIVANPGSNEIFVKAKSRAKEPNNLEVTTDKRLYSFDLVLNKDFKRDQDAMFRVTFNFPEEAKRVDQAAVAESVVRERLAAKTKPRNWKYAKEAVTGSEGIDPVAAYDDGRFTYFKFKGNKQMPAVFSVEGGGAEAQVATHVEGDTKDTLVVHRIGKRFVLRLDKQVVGIWNDGFGEAGVATADGVTVEGLKRVVRGQQ